MHVFYREDIPDTLHREGNLDIFREDLRLVDNVSPSFGFPPRLTANSRAEYARINWLVRMTSAVLFHKSQVPTPKTLERQNSIHHQTRSMSTCLYERHCRNSQIICAGPFPILHIMLECLKAIHVPVRDAASVTGTCLALQTSKD